MAAKEDDWIVRRRELAEARAKEGEHNLIWREMVRHECEKWKPTSEAPVACDAGSP